MTEPLHVIGSLFEACCPAKYKEYEDIYMRALDRGGTADISASDRQVSFWIVARRLNPLTFPDPTGVLHHGHSSQLPSRPA